MVGWWVGHRCIASEIPHVLQKLVLIVWYKFHPSSQNETELSLMRKKWKCAFKACSTCPVSQICHLKSLFATRTWGGGNTARVAERGWNDESVKKSQALAFSYELALNTLSRQHLLDLWEDYLRRWERCLTSGFLWSRDSVLSNAWKQCITNVTLTAAGSLIPALLQE